MHSYMDKFELIYDIDQEVYSIMYANIKRELISESRPAKYPAALTRPADSFVAKIHDRRYARCTRS